jgi:peroxiredoxin
VLRIDRLLPKELVEAQLLAADGGSRSLGELIAERPTLVVFLRHFGCIGCAEQVHDILPRLGELEALGVDVLLIGSGPAEHIDAWIERNDLRDKHARVVTDPSLAAYRAAGLARSFFATYGPRAVADFVRALARGHRPRPTDGDLFQQGGAFLVANGLIVWAQTNRSLGDHADPSDAVEAALLVGGRRAAAFV